MRESNIFWQREDATHNSLGSFAKHRDPYERKAVYVAPSTIPGAREGLFAKRDFEAHEMVAYFGSTCKFDIKVDLLIVKHFAQS